MRRALALALLPVTAATIGLGPATGATAAGEQKATVRAKGSVRFGDRVHLRGTFPGAPDAEVAILRREAGDSGYKRVARTHTSPRGRWSARVKPRHTGDWRAQLVTDPAAEPLAVPGDTRSDSERIHVRSVTRVGPAKRDVVAGQAIAVRGRVLPGGSRRDVVVGIGGQTERAHADRNGRFHVDWTAPAAGTYRVRATAKGNRDASGSKDSGGTVTAYRYAEASWYGPGFYGHRTACGQTLTPSTRGVANKSLPCGTKLTLRYGSRSVTVQVIDRGPYSGNREFDLTEATRNDLGFPSTGRVLSSR